MNIVKYRPVGKPNSMIVTRSVGQSKKQIYPRSRLGSPPRPSLADANRAMYEMGYVRAR